MESLSRIELGAMGRDVLTDCNRSEYRRGLAMAISQFLELRVNLGGDVHLEGSGPHRGHKNLR